MVFDNVGDTGSDERFEKYALPASLSFLNRGGDNTKECDVHPQRG